MSDAILSFLAAILCYVAVVFLIDQQLLKPRPYKVVWAVGLFVYGLGATAQFFATAGHWNQFEYRLWYLAGAILAAPYLGMGTFYLMGPRKWADRLMIFLGIFTTYAVVRMLSAPLAPQAERGAAPWSLGGLSLSQWFHTATNTEIVSGSHPLAPPDIIAVIIVLNTLGAAALVLGAAWSAWQFIQTRKNSSRLLSMILLVIGGLAPTLAGTMTKLGFASAFFALTFIGALFLLAGYLVSIDVLSVLRIPFTNKVLLDRRVAVAGATPPGQRR
jgi:hypothetical protein